MPIVVKINWTDLPLDNDIGFAEPGDPATQIEITKIVIGALGRSVGGRSRRRWAHS